MSAQRKLSKVAQAYERCKEAREALRQMDTRAMEQTEDKCGIVWERHLLQVRDRDVNGMPVDRLISIVLFATPDWWDIFVPVTSSPKTQDTIDVLKAMLR